MPQVSSPRARSPARGESRAKRAARGGTGRTSVLARHATREPENLRTREPENPRTREPENPRTRRTPAGPRRHDRGWRDHAHSLRRRAPAAHRGVAALLQQFGDDRGPSRLVAGAQARARVAVEI